jgi:hypothetical protein
LAETSPIHLATLVASQFFYTDLNPVGGKPYKYYVRAYNQLGGESPYSDPLSVSPIKEAEKMAAPILVDKGKDFITVNWTAPSANNGAEVTRYNLYARPEY